MQVYATKSLFDVKCLIKLRNNKGKRLEFIKTLNNRIYFCNSL